MNRQFPFLISLLLALAALAAFALPGVGQADPPAVVVSGAWSRPATETGVVYATLHNSGSVADRLIGASSPLADHVGLHQTYPFEVPSAEKPMGGMPADDMLTSMRAVFSIVIPAHGTTLLSPGGYHLMLDLRRQIAAGEIIPLRLHFARAGWIATRAAVRAFR